MKKENNDLSFEKALEKLQKIADKLEEGTESLEESVNLYKEGMELGVYCKQVLESAQQSVTVLEPK